MTDETKSVAEFATGLSSASIPTEIKERLRYLVLDNLASGYIGSHQEVYRRSIDATKAIAGTGNSHVFGDADTVDVSRASFLNGVAIGCFEADHTAGGAHPGGCVFPAIFALASSLSSSGEDTLRALAVGYEVNCRVARAQTNAAEHERGFHNPGISGPFGAAAGVAALLGLSVDETLWALGIAGSHAIGLIEFVWTGAMTKRIHEGRAAQLGLESALLAQHGVTGPPTIFEGPYGYLQAYSPKPIPEELVKGLGSRWTLEELRVKPYAGHGTAQPFIPVLDAWRKQDVDPEAITSIEITTSTQGTERRFQDLNPRSLLSIQYSIPFMVAVAIARGIDGCLRLDESVIDDQLVRDLAARVHIEVDSERTGNVISAGGSIIIRWDGESDTIEAPGIPRYDLGELRTLSHNKLRRYSEGILEEGQIAAIIDAVEHIDELAGIADLEQLAFSPWGS